MNLVDGELCILVPQPESGGMVEGGAISSGGCTWTAVPINSCACIVKAYISPAKFTTGISAYTPVILNSAPRTSSQDNLTGVIFSIDDFADTDNAQWGITQRYGSGGEIVPVLIQGFSPARVGVDNGIAAGDGLSPKKGTNDSLVTSGNARSLAKALTTPPSSGGYVFSQLFGRELPPPTVYSGYFTLSMTNSTAAGVTITIKDGATGGNSTAVVNGGTTYSLPPYTETVSVETVFMLKYTPAQYNSGGALVSDATMVVSSVPGSSLPSGGTSGAYYYQLGRVVQENSVSPLKLVQDHTAGVVQFQWFANCYHG